MLKASFTDTPQALCIQSQVAQVSGEVQEMLGHGEFLNSNREDGHQTKLQRPRADREGVQGMTEIRFRFFTIFLFCDSCYVESIGTSGDSENHRGFWI